MAKHISLAGYFNALCIHQHKRDVSASGVARCYHMTAVKWVQGAHESALATKDKQIWNSLVFTRQCFGTQRKRSYQD